MTSESILITCKRRYTKYARLTQTESHIRIEFGNFKSGSFNPIHREDLSIEENPELADLYDGNAWDWQAVRDLVESAGKLSTEQNAQVYLSAEDLGLLREAGLELAI